MEIDDDEDLRRSTRSARTRRCPTRTGSRRRSGQPDHEDEGRAHAPGLQGGARGGPGDGPGDGGGDLRRGRVRRRHDRSRRRSGPRSMSARWWAAKQLRDVVADKGYHKAQTLVDLEAQGLRTYISERETGRASMDGQARGAREGLRANRREDPGHAQQEAAAASFGVDGALLRPHLRDGECSKILLRGLEDVRKRQLALVAGRNLGVIMRRAFGFGTPRSMQDLTRLLSALRRALSALGRVLRTPYAPSARFGIAWAA